MAAAKEIRIGYAQGEEEIAACFDLMRQLRPHLDSAADFARRWHRQGESGYRLAVAWQDGLPVALAGFRVHENLVHGRHLHVDDLVTDKAVRSAGHGRRLMDWLKAEAAKLECGKLVLDAALTNGLGHRFYFRQGFLAIALGFSLPLPP